MLEAGEALVDVTPPLGIEMAGFHREPGNERIITGIRQPAFVRALVLRCKGAVAAMVSVETCGVSRAFARRVQVEVAKQLKIPADQVRICATHTHSMPTFRYCRQWGAVPNKYMAFVEKRIVEAVGRAKEDLAPADLYVGKQRVVGGNFNRTTKTWKTDKEFTKSSTDEQRWLDTMLHVLHFHRGESKRGVLWYHFSAHPVCYTDGQAGPDWPGLVEEKARAGDKLRPTFLQGHAGDVNPGDGKPWIGDPVKTSEAVYAALHHAINHARRVKADVLRGVSKAVKVPLDVRLLGEQVAQYREDPSKCVKGEWVDARFAKAWFDSASKWNPKKDTYAAPVSALRLGEVGLVFHPAELYSYYGLAIRRDSPFADTLVVGYADDLIGYLPDPQAYKAGEYAATTVPKILDLPPFTPTAARAFTAGASSLLQNLA